MADLPTAIVTGASRGIGKGIALELARMGYNLVITHVSEPTLPTETLAEFEAAGTTCKPLRADVANGADRRELVAFTKETFGRCDLLCNNAGVAPLNRVDLLEASEESYDRVMSVNLKGPYFLTQLVANWMIEQKRQYPERGYRIVNVGSISAYTSSPARGEYCVSKAGMGMMTLLYADRLAEYGIGVFEVRPGVTLTDMTGAVKKKYDKLIAEGLTPIRRWGLPADIGRAVRAIAEGRLDFCAGQVINADGGFHIRRL